MHGLAHGSGHGSGQLTRRGGLLFSQGFLQLSISNGEAVGLVPVVAGGHGLLGLEHGSHGSTIPTQITFRFFYT